MEVLSAVGVVQYFRGRSHVETNMAEQTPLKHYAAHALRGVRVGLLAFALTLVTMVVVKLARTGHESSPFLVETLYGS